MKSFLALTFVFSFSLNGFSQKKLSQEKRDKLIHAEPVAYLDDTIYSNAKPYCLMIELVSNPNHPDYAVKNFRNEKLLTIYWNEKESVTGFYIFQFAHSGNKVRLDIVDEEKIPALIVSNDLFVKDEIPAISEKNFISNNGGIFTGKQIPFKEISPDSFAVIKNTGEISLQNIPMKSDSLSPMPDSVVIPLFLEEGGVYSFHCEIGGVPVSFELDCGAADVILSRDIYDDLKRKGALINSKLLDASFYTMANGTSTMAQEITIDEINIGGIRIRNVRGAVINGKYVTPLFGISAIKKLKKIVLDCKNETLTVYKE